jgi:hypothetical protein
MSEQMMADVKPMNPMAEQSSPTESITAKAEDALYSNKDVTLEAESKKPEASETEVAPPTENKIEKAEEVIDYKLTLKEGSLLDPGSLEVVKTFAKDYGLSNEAAQAVLSNQESFLDQIQKAEADSYEAEIKQWREEVINDKNLGGANLAKTAESAKKAVSRFGDESFIKILNETGLGDNISFVRFLSNIGQMMSDDSLVTSKGQMAQKSVEELFYGNQN